MVNSSPSRDSWFTGCRIEDDTVVGCPYSPHEIVAVNMAWKVKFMATIACMYIIHTSIHPYIHTYFILYRISFKLCCYYFVRAQNSLLTSYKYHRVLLYTYIVIISVAVCSCGQDFCMLYFPASGLSFSMSVGCWAVFPGFLKSSFSGWCISPRCRIFGFNSYTEFRNNEVVRSLISNTLPLWLQFYLMRFSEGDPAVNDGVSKTIGMLFLLLLHLTGVCFFFCSVWHIFLTQCGFSLML